MSGNECLDSCTPIHDRDTISRGQRRSPPKKCFSSILRSINPPLQAMEDAPGRGGYQPAMVVINRFLVPSVAVSPRSRWTASIYSGPAKSEETLLLPPTWIQADLYSSGCFWADIMKQARRAEGCPIARLTRLGGSAHLERRPSGDICLLFVVAFSWCLTDLAAPAVQWLIDPDPAATAGSQDLTTCISCESRARLARIDRLQSSPRPVPSSSRFPRPVAPWSFPSSGASTTPSGGHWTSYSQHWRALTRRAASL
jgi:hypothetical protein